MMKVYEVWVVSPLNETQQWLVVADNDKEAEDIVMRATHTTIVLTSHTREFDLTYPLQIGRIR